jgi:hypothetical protein
MPLTSATTLHLPLLTAAAAWVYVCVLHHPQAALMARLQLEYLFLRGHSATQSRSGRDPFNAYVQSNTLVTSYEKVRGVEGKL